MSLLSRITADLDLLVSTESPSSDRELLARCADVVARLGTSWMGVEPRLIDTDGVTNLLWQFGDSVDALLLCHYDTVWPAGTIDRWPFHVDGDRATGPGVFDMKGGIIQAFAAVAGLPSREGIAVLVTGDEEVGSTRSKPLIEECAREAGAVLVLEASIHGALKTGRKGASFWTATFRGRSAHAGLDPDDGANVISAIAAWVPRVHALADRHAETSVVVTTGRAGSSMNTVPDFAELTVDSRAFTVAEQERVAAEIRTIGSDVDGVSISYAGGINRPPLEESMSRELRERFDRVARDLGHEPLGWERVGGASDGNITAAVGTPTLDGMGAVGGHAHAEGEWASLAELCSRAELLTAFLAELTGARRGD